MFEKMVMGKFYRNAKSPKDIPWHRDDPEAFVVNVLKERGKRGRVLDIGCGTGSFSVFLAKQGYDVTGLDIFPQALEMGKKLAQNEGVTVNWVAADLFTWKPQNQFDLVLDSGCLHALVGGNVHKYKEQLMSWLAPGGDFVLGHWGKKHSLDWLPIGPRRRTREQILELLSPEFKEVKFHQELITGVAAPFGPTVMGMGFWFQKI